MRISLKKMVCVTAVRFWGGTAAITHAKTVLVKAGSSLQAAISDAQDGDVLEIEHGLYVGNFLVNKRSDIAWPEKAHAERGMHGDTIRVTAPDVVLEGLIVRDSGDSLKIRMPAFIFPGAHRAVVRNSELTYNLFGLWIEKSNDVLIEANTITGKRDYNSSQRGNGVQLYNTNGAKILNNHISFVRDALYVDVSHHALFKGNKLHHSRYGSHYMNSYYNVGKTMTVTITVADWR
jgi:nitrous oxidase accessory protein